MTIPTTADITAAIRTINPREEFIRSEYPVRYACLYLLKYDLLGIPKDAVVAVSARSPKAMNLSNMEDAEEFLKEWAFLEGNKNGDLTKVATPLAEAYLYDLGIFFIPDDEPDDEDDD